MRNRETRNPIVNGTFFRGFSQNVVQRSSKIYAPKRSQLCSHARPVPDLRDAHAPVRQPAHRDPVHPRSSIQAGAESAAAPLVRAYARNIEVLTDSQISISFSAANHRRKPNRPDRSHKPCYEARR